MPLDQTVRERARLERRTVGRAPHTPPPEAPARKRAQATATAATLPSTASCRPMEGSLGDARSRA